jgi:hypothetical protein
MSTFNGENIIISFVGARDSGKSHCIGVLIPELKKIAHAFGGTIETHDLDETSERYDSKFGSLWEGRKLHQTESADATQDFRNSAIMPFVYMFDLPSSESFSVFIYDVAGEDLMKTDNVDRLAQATYNANVLIFILDPTKIDTIRDAMSKELLAGAEEAKNENASPKEILERIKNVSKGKHSKMRLAVVLAKLDVLEEMSKGTGTSAYLKDELTNVFRESLHCLSTERLEKGEQSYFNNDDANAVNTEVRRFLMDNNGFSDFREYLEKEFRRRYFYFAASALGYGNNPKGDVIHSPTPHRITDPLLWALKEKGIIQSRGKDAASGQFIAAAKEKISELTRKRRKILVAASLVLLVAVSFVTISLFAMNNNYSNAYRYMEVTSPRRMITGLVGMEAIDIEVSMTQRAMGWGRQEISYVMRPFGRSWDILNSGSESIVFLPGASRTITLSPYYFAMGSDYVLSILVNGILLREINLHGR